MDIITSAFKDKKQAEKFARTANAIFNTREIQAICHAETPDLMLGAQVFLDVENDTQAEEAFSILEELSKEWYRDEKDHPDSIRPGNKESSRARMSGNEPSGGVPKLHQET